MQTISCKLLVIGAGPGGYVCGIRAGQLGVDTIVVEAQNPGGTCLNVGCIPSKALIHAANEFARVRGGAAGNALGISAGPAKIDLVQTMAWKNDIVARLNRGVCGLLAKANTRLVLGRAQILDGKTVDIETKDGPLRVRCDTLVIATGSAPAELASLPFGGLVISSTTALALERVPDRLVVVGGGYIGLEIGTALAKLGAKVTIVEAADRLLPQYDAELTGPLLARLQQLGVSVHLNARAQGLAPDGAALLVQTGGDMLTLPADKVLLAVGRVPVTTGFGLQDLGLAMAGAYLAIDDRCATSMRGVYAIGDITGEPMLAHRAMAQGEMVAEIVAGGSQRWDKKVIPAICFTDPEIVTAGLSPEEARAGGHQIVVGSFPFAANGRAMATGDDTGFVRVVAKADSHVVLGIQATGAGISELAASFGLAIEMGARLEDIAATVHAHPSQGEALQEAALNALDRTIHM